MPIYVAAGECASPSELKPASSAARGADWAVSENLITRKPRSGLSALPGSRRHVNDRAVLLSDATGPLSAR